MLARVDAFIDRNLADPELTPAAIAAHHHISLRALHELFRGRERTVAATIRHRRLERCRADLTQPRLAHVPLHAIAMRHGFTSAAAFSRAFRASFAVTAQEVRHERALRPAPPVGAAGDESVRSLRSGAAP
ncbi:helix-turn-helix domain-containing protein [Streptomyces purpureus]|uniref:helix-turn-helix domain-containing protein n=1 Tax=Streptomyces purpureus TaxID=1951 RepID=UPI000371B00E|nr:helix-turn-helix domain-containing protein [Streptomyces purpureus]